ncbi:HesA/MoeB/ThiF family protein [Desulfofalx alkaliphila]|uniref:HesA/MoeB/ThiF family protein n=1 Tax=Desulfofalx alkaliphila TaxID=105483 RepID=UPI0004E1BF64|nr:HesA/MoeB/ThiF family protein [Desulfofalx alkaliphila]
MSALNEQQLARYRRNILLASVGEEGQQKLLKSKVLVVGAGGLGSPVSYYLAAAGIGTLGILDDDVVDLSNLQRQILHTSADVGRPKVLSAADKLRALNPDINVITYQQKLNEESAEEIIADYQLVVDATDNFGTRQIMNRVCVKLGKPFIYGGVLAMQGQAMTVIPGEGPCFTCIFRNEPPANAPTTSTVGVLGAVAGLIGTIEATEAIKLLLKIGTPLVGRMFTVDLIGMNSDQVEVRRDLNCPVCGSK